MKAKVKVTCPEVRGVSKVDGELSVDQIIEDVKSDTVHVAPETIIGAINRLEMIDENIDKKIAELTAAKESLQRRKDFLESSFNELDDITIKALPAFEAQRNDGTYVCEIKRSKRNTFTINSSGIIAIKDKISGSYFNEVVHVNKKQIEADFKSGSLPSEVAPFVTHSVGSTNKASFKKESGGEA